LARKPLELVSSAFALGDEALVWLVEKIPLQAKHRLLRLAVRLAIFLFKLLPSRLARRGLSDSLSVEAHAINSLLWWARFLPITLPRLRLGLSSLAWTYPPAPGVKEELIELPDKGVRGLYLHTAPPSVEDPPVILFYFGGAFFGGSIEDNRGFIERYTERLQCDAFLADYSLCPENMIEQAYRDSCRAYEWLLTRKAPEKIVLMGNSSGGGVCLRVLQLAAAAAADSSERGRFFLGEGPVPQPAGAAMMGPFVNYTVGPGEDEGNSMVRHQAMDNIVTERVYEFVQPRLAAACGGEEGKRKVSPLFHDMKGLCPMLVSFSSHEVCADDNRALVDKARQAGCQVVASERPFLCHAYQAFAGLMPEGEEEERKICEWIRGRGPAWGA